MEKENNLQIKEIEMLYTLVNMRMDHLKEKLLIRENDSLVTSTLIKYETIRYKLERMIKELEIEVL